MTPTRILITILLLVARPLFAQGLPHPPKSTTLPKPSVVATRVDRSVRFVYLVSNNRNENPAYKAGIEMAALSIQAWYFKQLGATFLVNSPVVEVVHSDQKAAWFYDNPNGENPDDWGYNNTFDEAHHLVGGVKNDPHYIWVIYSDGPGNKGRGGSGVCIMPEDDLLGLTGKHAEQKDISRWVAGLGHELGHAFGLNHPADIVKDADAIMWTGIYGKYPDHCYLTGDDMEILLRSPFFFDGQGNPILGTFEVAEVYNYNEGKFTKTMNNANGDIVWWETKADASATYDFIETDHDDRYYFLASVNRHLWIRIPIGGGDAGLSMDAGKNWSFFKAVKLEE